MLGKSDHGPSAVDPETEGFKVWRQVPAMWLYVVSCFTVVSLLIGIVAIALGAAAVTKSDDNKSSLETLEQEVAAMSVQQGSIVQPQVTEEQPPVQLQQSQQAREVSVTTDVNQETMNAGSVPGKNFSSNKGPNNPFRESVFSVVVHGLDTNTFWYTVQQGIADAADFFRCCLPVTGALSVVRQTTS